MSRKIYGIRYQLLLVGLLAGISATSWAADNGENGKSNEKVAVVDVSKVFVNCTLLKNEQRQINARLADKQTELNARAKQLRENRRKLKEDAEDLPVKDDLGFFDRKQEQARNEFIFQKDYREFEKLKQRLETEAMKNVLTAIRDAIKKEAEEHGIYIVLRTADKADEVQPPAAEKTNADKKEVWKDLQEKLKPRSTFAVIERFRRNPILSAGEGESKLDITQGVLDRLNGKAN